MLYWGLTLGSQDSWARLHEALNPKAQTGPEQDGASAGLRQAPNRGRLYGSSFVGHDHCLLVHLLFILSCPQGPGEAPVPLLEATAR